MSLKLIGGTVAVLALTAIFFFHGGHKSEAPKAAAPVVFVPLPVPAPTPAPLPVKPIPKKVVMAPPLKIAPPAKPVAKKPLDMSVSCRIARSMVVGKTPAQLTDMREKYHTTDEEIAQYQHCF